MSGSGERALGGVAEPGASGSDRARLRKDLAAVEGGRRWLRRLLVVLALAAIVAGVLVYRAKTAPPPPAMYVVAELSRGDVVETVQSTGQVKPVTEVQVGAQVSGRITEVYVDFNSVVKAGEPLAEIDPTLYSAQIDSSSAQLAAASASVRRAQANLEATKLRLDRAKKLVADGLGPQADLDTIQGQYDVAVADLAAARAQVAQIGAQLKQSKTNLEFTKILSPIDGVVINRAIDPGQTVQASFQAPVLFVLAQDLRKMRVFADIDEADVGRLEEGMTAEITVDAFTGTTFAGKVVQVRFSPMTQQGVVTYAAVIDVDNPELKLRPGMTATVTIKTAEVKDVQRLPNAALRFRPSPPVDEAGKPIPQEPLPKLEQGKGRVWVIVDETPGQEKIEPKIVDVGISDGIHTVVRGELDGLKIVRDETDAANPKRKRGLF
jgi:HlyD family secretion protein